MSFSRPSQIILNKEETDIGGNRNLVSTDVLSKIEQSRLHLCEDGSLRVIKAVSYNVMMAILYY